MTTPSRDERLRVFIGDVQGCDDELGDLLDELAFDPARHRLWFVGDLVNRGPASLRVLRRVRELAAGAVLGNHDLHLLARASGERRAGSSDTLDDVLQAPDRDELLDWLRHRPLLEVFPDLVLVHAGLPPDGSDVDALRAVASRLEECIRAGRIPWSDPELAFLTRARFCSADGRLPDDDVDPGPLFAPWDAHYRGQRTVVFGHWARRGLVRGPRVRGLDTGCVWGGALTCWIAEEDRFVSVPARKVYRPL